MICSNNAWNSLQNSISDEDVLDCHTDLQAYDRPVMLKNRALQASSPRQPLGFILKSTSLISSSDTCLVGFLLFFGDHSIKSKAVDLQVVEMLVWFLLLSRCKNVALECLLFQTGFHIGFPLCLPHG